MLPGFVLTTAADGDDHAPGGAVHRAWCVLSGNGSRALVVRSSSTVEDLAERSMAGRYESVVGVEGWEAFVEAVRTVQASRVKAAAGNDALTGNEPMAVLVQPLLDATAGGATRMTALPTTSTAMDATRMRRNVLCTTSNRICRLGRDHLAYVAVAVAVEVRGRPRGVARERSTNRERRKVALMVKRRTACRSRIVSVPALALLVVALASCAKARMATDGEEVPPGDDLDVVADQSDHDLAIEPLEDEENPGPAAIDEPDPFVGATITVTGTVDEVVDRNAFEIAAEGRGGAGFLVLVPDDDVGVGDIVEVTGTVRGPDFDELRADLDFEIDPDLYSQSDRQRVIVAESVEVVGQGVG